MVFTDICWICPVFAYKLEIPHIYEADINLRLMKIAEVVLKNTLREWQSNHLLCLH